MENQTNEQNMKNNKLAEVNCWNKLPSGCIIRDIEFVQLKLQEDQNVWQMLFDVEKWLQKSQCPIFNYTLDSKLLVKVSEEKDLGVMLSSDVKVSQQCAQAYSKAKLLGVLNRSVVYKSKDIMFKLYKFLVCPHMEYCTAWSPHYVRNKHFIASSIKDLFHNVEAHNIIDFIHKIIDFIKETRFYKQL